MALRLVSLGDLEHGALYPIVNFFEKGSLRKLEFDELAKFNKGGCLLIELGLPSGKRNTFLVEVVVDFAGVILDGTCLALCGHFRVRENDPKTLKLTWDVYYESKDSNSFSIRKY